MANNTDPLFVDPVLLQRAEQLCQQRLERDAENRAALRSLAEVHRKLGKLREAAAAYDRLFRLDPQDQEAGYMQAVLGGKEWPTPPRGLRAAPFVLLKDFLPPEFHDALLPFLIAFGDVFLMPAAEDSGTAIGAAYDGLFQLTGATGAAASPTTRWVAPIRPRTSPAQSMRRPRSSHPRPPTR